MAAKSEKAAELEKQTAEILADSNRGVSAETTKQKLIDLFTAKVNASANAGSGTNYGPVMLVLLFLFVIGGTFVWYIKNE